MHIAANAFIDAGREMGKQLEKHARPKVSKAKSTIMKSGRWVVSKLQEDMKKNEPSVSPPMNFRDLDTPMIKSDEDIVDNLKITIIDGEKEAVRCIENKQKIEKLNRIRNERKNRRRQRSRRSLAANGLKSNNTKPILPDHRKEMSKSNLRPRTAGAIFYDVSKDGAVHRAGDKLHESIRATSTVSRESPVYTISNDGKDLIPRPKTAPTRRALKTSVPRSTPKLTKREKNRSPHMKVYTISESGDDFTRQDESKSSNVGVQSWFE